MAKLQHPAIVSIYTVGEERGIPYFAMERVRGATLADILTMVESRAPESLRGKDLREAVLGGSSFETIEDNEATRRLFDSSWTDACARVVSRIADALAHAHSRGVLHRDIKPSNVAVTPAGRVVPLDFGLATASVDVRMTTYGTAVGSVLCMAPEQIEGRIDEIDGRTDIYALGVTLYELLTLQVPCSGRTSDELRTAIRDGKVPSLRVRNHRVSSDLETVCLKAIEGERGRRSASMQEFAADLKRVLAREPIAARPRSAAVRTLRWIARNPAITLASLLVAVLLLGVPTLQHVQQLSYGNELERALNAEMLACDAETQAREFADRERERAQLEARDSETVAGFLADIFASADPQREQGRPPTAAELLRRGVTRIERELADQPELRARLQIANAIANFNAHESELTLIHDAWAARELEQPEGRELRVAVLDSLAFLNKMQRSSAVHAWAAFELAHVRAESGDWQLERERTVEPLRSAMPMSDWRSRRWLQEEATELARRAWGERSPRYAEQLAMLGSLRGALGELDAALTDLDTAGAILTSSLGPEYPMSLCCARTAPDVELRMGHGEQACERLDRPADGVRARLGDEHLRPVLVWLTSAGMSQERGASSSVSAPSCSIPGPTSACSSRSSSTRASTSARSTSWRWHSRARTRACTRSGAASCSRSSARSPPRASPPTADARARLERRAAQLRVALGSESAIYRRVLRHSTVLLQRIEDSTPTPAR